MPRTMTIGGLYHRAGGPKDTIAQLLAFQSFVLTLMRRKLQ